MGSDTLVHDERAGKVHVLNSSAAQILALCNGMHNAEDIALVMSRQTGRPRDQMIQDVSRALRIFEELDLIKYP